MNISMEIDNNDPESSHKEIKDYLKHKVDEMKLLSSIAEKELNEVQTHKNLCLDLLNKGEHFGSQNIEIKDVWQSIHNEKWVIGISIKNTSDLSFRNVSVILKYETKPDLNYSIKIYTKHKPEKCEELEMLCGDPEVREIVTKLKSNKTPVKDEWLETQELKNCSTVVVLIDIPKFINFKSLVVNGVLTYEKGEKKFRTSVPNFILSVNDVTNDKLAVKSSNVIKGDEAAYLSILATSCQKNVKIIIPEGIYRTLEGILQIDCFFTKIESHSSGLTLLFDGNSSILNSSMLEFYPGEQDVKLITKNEEQLNYLLHHLYNNIPEVVILDKNTEVIRDLSVYFTRPTQSFVHMEQSNQETFKEFCASLKKQIDFVEKNLTDCNKMQQEHGDLSNTKIAFSSEKYKTFRKNLAALEKKTDVLYSDICNKLNVTSQ